MNITIFVLKICANFYDDSYFVQGDYIFSVRSFTRFSIFTLSKIGTITISLKYFIQCRIRRKSWSCWKRENIKIWSSVQNSSTNLEQYVQRWTYIDKLQMSIVMSTPHNFKKSFNTNLHQYSMNQFNEKTNIIFLTKPGIDILELKGVSFNVYQELIVFIICYTL